MAQRGCIPNLKRNEFIKIKIQVTKRIRLLEFLYDMNSSCKSFFFCEHNLHVVSVFLIKGLGTTDSVLIRIMVSRAEIDMLDIKSQFQKIYGKTLHSFIKVRARDMLWSAQALQSISHDLIMIIAIPALFNASPLICGRFIVHFSHTGCLFFCFVFSSA